MSLKGGYKIIDLKGIDVTQSTMMIEGIYESIESNYGKPLLISGIVIEGVEKDDVFVQATLNGTAYEFEVYSYTIQVQDTDAVNGSKFKPTTTTPLTPLGATEEGTTIDLHEGGYYIIYSSTEGAYREINYLVYIPPYNSDENSVFPFSLLTTYSPSYGQTKIVTINITYIGGSNVTIKATNNEDSSAIIVNVKKVNIN